jgi:hypothetical protein
MNHPTVKGFDFTISFSLIKLKTKYEAVIILHRFQEHLFDD